MIVVFEARALFGKNAHPACSLDQPSLRVVRICRSRKRLLRESRGKKRRILRPFFDRDAVGQHEWRRSPVAGDFGQHASFGVSRELDFDERRTGRVSKAHCGRQSAVVIGCDLRRRTRGRIVLIAAFDVVMDRDVAHRECFFLDPACAVVLVDWASPFRNRTVWIVMFRFSRLPVAIERDDRDAARCLPRAAALVPLGGLDAQRPCRRRTTAPPCRGRAASSRRRTNPVSLMQKSLPAARASGSRGRQGSGKAPARRAPTSV